MLLAERPSGATSAVESIVVRTGPAISAGYAAAFALAMAGDPSRSRALADDLARDHPTSV